MNTWPRVSSRLRCEHSACSAPPIDTKRQFIARWRDVTRRSLASGRLWRIGCSAHRARNVTLACALLLAASSAQARRVLVVQGNDSPRLARTLQALQANAGVPVDVIRLASERDVALESALAKPERDRVIVALGPRASDMLVKLTNAVPVIHCLAGPDALRAGLPSVPSDPPTDQQATWLKKLVPSARSVGVLFDPSTTTRRAEAIAASLDSAGYQVLLQPVVSAASLPSSLAAMTGRADVLLALPDRTVYAPEAVNGILLFSFRNAIPVIGPNDAWVRRGALFAVDWDYEEVGALCASLALREMRTVKAPIASPLARVWVNAKLASRFGLRWDDDLLRSVIRHE